MSDININQIKYLDYDGLQVLWRKISDTFLRDSEVVTALTDTTGGIIEKEEDLFVQSKTLNSVKEELIGMIGSSQGANIDNDTIINEDGVLKTNLILQNDKDNHILKLITGNGKGTTVSEWDYTEFYEEAVKDGIFDDVSLVVIPGDEPDSGQAAGTYLKFIFNTSSGQKPIYVNVTELIDVYDGSDYISVTKKEDGTSSIELNKAKLVEDLKKADALDITSITTKIEGLEGKYAELEGLINELKTAWEGLDISGLQEQVASNTANITNILATAPTVRITDEEIDALDTPTTD